MAIRSYRMAHRSADHRLPVSPAVPTLFLLVADASARAGTNDWRVCWKHKTQPMYRLGLIMPREPEFKSFVINMARRIDHKRFYRDVCAMGALLIDDLADDMLETIAEVNTSLGPYETRHAINGNGRSVTSVTPDLPENYALPFVGPGFLVFQNRPLCLAGLEVELAA